MLLLYFVLGGLMLGLLSGGRLSRLSNVHILWWPVALGGLAFQVLLFGPPLADMVGQAGPALYVASSAAVMVALLRNLRQPGFAVIAVGAALNLLVIVANGGQMPASPEAWALLTGVPEVPTVAFSNSALSDPATRFAFLGDIFVLPRPMPFANIFSIGDVIIGLGGALFLTRTMHSGKEKVATPRGAATSIA